MSLASHLSSCEDDEMIEDTQLRSFVEKVEAFDQEQEHYISS